MIYNIADAKPKFPGRTAITRLLTVVKNERIATLRLRALLLAIRCVKRDTLDYELYGNLVEDLNGYRQRGETEGGSGMEVLDGELIAREDFPDLHHEVCGRLDDGWLSSTSQTVKKEEDKLEAEMRNYSVNLIKESIRVSH
jgi:hypothetical protein